MTLKYNIIKIPLIVIIVSLLCHIVIFFFTVSAINLRKIHYAEMMYGLEKIPNFESKSGYSERRSTAETVADLSLYNES